MKITIAQKTWIKDNDVRLDASFHLSKGRKTRILFNHSPFPISSIGDLSTNIFYGGRAKRTYVENSETGISFVGSSDMLKAEFSNLKRISKKYTPKLENYFLETGWTLISRSGTVGKTVFVSKDLIGKAASEHIIRVEPNKSKIKSGFLYAFLSSKFGYSLLTQGTFGAVIQHIEPDHVASIPIFIPPEQTQEKIHHLVIDASRLRVEGNKLLREAELEMKEQTGLLDLKSSDYEHFGANSIKRKVSIFKRKVNELSSTTINAFNYSKKIEAIRERIIETGSYKLLSDCLTTKGFFHTGAFRRLELKSKKSIQLINQSDIFNIKMVGKQLAPRYIKAKTLVEYGEVLIAGVGTLGENETFCRTIFAGEELEGKLISGEFIRMNTNETVPPGYLYSFLASDYGFRLIRSTQAGTKLCRPIKELLKDIPVPILPIDKMNEIDTKVKKAFTMRNTALEKENNAISIIEKEIESWQS